MFYKATSFNQDISDWDVSSVTNFTNYGNGASGHSNSEFKNSDAYYFTINTPKYALSSNVEPLINTSNANTIYASNTLSVWQIILRNSVTQAITTQASSPSHYIIQLE